MIKLNLDCRFIARDRMTPTLTVTVERWALKRIGRRAQRLAALYAQHPRAEVQQIIRAARKCRKHTQEQSATGFRGDEVTTWVT